MIIPRVADAYVRMPFCSGRPVLHATATPAPFKLNTPELAGSLAVSGRCLPADPLRIDILT